MLYFFDNYTLDTNNFVVMQGGQNIPCEPKVFNLIVYLIEQRERLVTRDELFQKIWSGRDVSDTSLSNHIKSARKIFADDGQSQRVIKTVHGRGYQFIAELTAEEPASVKSTSDNNVKQKTAIFLGVICVIGLLVSGFYFSHQKEPTNYLLAVLPFTNTKPDETSDYLGVALADRVINQLTYVNAINVRSSMSIRQYTGQSVDIKKAAENLNVDYVLTGYYLNIDNRIRLNVELLDTISNELVWRSGAIEVDYKDVFELQDIVANSVVNGLTPNFPDTKTKGNQFTLNSNIDVAAFELYLRSIAEPFSQVGHSKAIDFLKKALEIEPNYAPFYVQLGNRIRYLEQFSLINTGESHDTLRYYKKALLLDPYLLSAMSHLALVYTETNRIDEAMELAIRMLKINPNNAKTRFTLGYIFRYAGLIDDSFSEIELALRLDPKNIMFRSIVAMYSATGEHQKALKQLSQYPDSSFTTAWLGILNLKAGHNERAIEHFNTLINTSPNGLWALVGTIHKAAVNGSLEDGLIAVHQLEQTNVTDSETVFYNALYYCMLGDNSRCIHSYKKAVESGYYNTAFIDKGAVMDAVKGNPEFMVLYQKAKQKSDAFRQKYELVLSSIR